MTSASDALDANAVLGDLSEVFVGDVSSALLECRSCGSTRPLAEARAHTRTAGVVLRCGRCDAVLLALARAPESCWLDLGGTRRLNVPLPREPGR